MTIFHSGSEALLSKTIHIAKILVALAIVSCNPGSARAEPSRDDVAALAGTIVQKLHAVGAQIYECEADAQGQLAWTFREPIASLMNGRQTVGRHFAGPSWEMADGSRIMGKVVAQAAAPSTSDIPWLKLEVSARTGS